MFASGGIATIYVDLSILLCILTLKVTQQLMHEVIFIVPVSLRNNAEACLSCIMHKTW